MRRIIFLLIPVLFAVSCVQDITDLDESVDGSTDKIEMSFNAVLDAQTKLTIGDPVQGSDGYEYPVLWKNEDAISIFPHIEGSTDTLSSNQFITYLDEPSVSTTFTGFSELADTYYALYPYSPLHQWLPEEMAIYARMFYAQYTENYLRPSMIAIESDGKLSFQHLFGFIKLTVPDTVTDLARIKFSATNTHIAARFMKIYPETMTIGELITPMNYVNLYPTDGTVIKPGTYYMYAIPALMQEGFSLEFFDQDGLRYKKSTDKQAEIKRSTILNLGTVSELKFDYPVSTCAEVLNNGEDGQYYRLQGEVTAISNTKYGNWYLSDGTGEIYIYGTINQYGSYINWEEAGIEVGDIVTVQGPRKTYGDIVELLDANIVEIEKTCVKVQSISLEGGIVPADGGSFEVTLSLDGEDFTASVPESAQSWLSVSDVVVSGTEAVVTYAAAPNDGTHRSATLVFSVRNNGKEYRTYVSVEQEILPVEAVAADINAAPDGIPFILTGFVSEVVNTKYGNLYINDYSGSVYVYGTYDAAGNRFDAFQTPVNAGDIITVYGEKISYRESPQMKNVVVKNHLPVRALSVLEFLEAEADSDAYYRLAGTVTNIQLNPDGTQNGGGYFDLVDETGTVYVNGLLRGWGDPEKEFQSLGINEGDLVFLVGKRSENGESPMVTGAFYVYHEPLEFTE